VNKQEFSASIWRSNQGYTKMHRQPTIKILLDGNTQSLDLDTHSNMMRCVVNVIGFGLWIP